MRTPGTLIRALSVLAAASAAAYFWSTALTGRTAKELLRGDRNVTRITQPVVTPARPKPQPAPTQNATPSQPVPQAATQLGPVPIALARALEGLGTAGTLPPLVGNPFGGLIGTITPPIRQQQAPGTGAGDAARRDRAAGATGRLARHVRRVRARRDRRQRVDRDSAFARDDGTARRPVRSGGVRRGRVRRGRGRRVHRRGAVAAHRCPAARP